VVDTYDDHEPCSCRRKLHDESRLIQRSFDDNKGDDKKLKGQEHFMITKMMISKNQRMSSRCSRGNLISRIKIQGSSFQKSRSRFKTQDSRIKGRINQDK